MARPYISTRIGERFNRWTVIGDSVVQGKNRTVPCRCDCGAERNVRPERLRSGDSRSCGCLAAEEATRHGLSTSNEYAIWRTMIQRTINPNHNRYQHYGALGIMVCERWRKFENFYADMGPRPGKGYSIERINNDGNYEPGNCKWATNKEQSLNKRANRLITANGKTMPMIKWSRAIGASGCTISERIKGGWDVERAATAPIIKP